MTFWERVLAAVAPLEAHPGVYSYPDTLTVLVLAMTMALIVGTTWRIK